MLSVDFINVGYGDSILVHDDLNGPPRGARPINRTLGKPFVLLIDSGDTNTGMMYENSLRTSAADFLKHKGITVIDVFLLTHLHRDHIGGLPKIMENIVIRELWVNCLLGPSLRKRKARQNGRWDMDSNDTVFALNLYLDILNKLYAKGTTFRVLNGTGNCRLFSKQLTEELFIECTFADPSVYRRQDGLIADILSHRSDNEDAQYDYLYEQVKNLNSILNDTSIRVTLKYRGTVVALPGDVSASCWIRQRPQKCTVLKVPHHGHRDGMTEELVSFLKPEYFVLSVSNDRKDPCPHPDSVNIIRQCAGKCFVTDALSIPGVTEKTFHASVRFEFDDRLIFTGSCMYRV